MPVPKAVYGGLAKEDDDDDDWSSRLELLDSFKSNALVQRMTCVFVLNLNLMHLEYSANIVIRFIKLLVFKTVRFI